MWIYFLCCGAGIVVGAIIAELLRKRNAPAIYKILSAHFAPVSIATVTVTEREFPARVRVDLHRAIARSFERCKVSQSFGVRVQDSMMFGMSLSDLLTYDTSATAVPLEYEEIDVGEEQPIRCLKNALWLLESNGAKIAVLLSQKHNFHNNSPTVRIDVGAENNDAGATFTRTFYTTLEGAVRKAESYRGKVLSLDVAGSYTGQSSGITVHRFEPVKRADVILPVATLDLLDRNVVEFVARREDLIRLGQSGKKGLLFHGPPGNGKTHTIRYLIGELRGHTTILVTSEQMGRLAEYMALARLLQPSILVIEDVDLIARSRTEIDNPCQESLLNKLLNEMDGLNDDSQIIFLLTTNRPEELEQALAARPGRIDQAVEFPLPEQAGRDKLVRLYAKRVRVSDALVALIVERTEGVSAAFIKELMRRAIQHNLVLDADGSELTSPAVQHALEELLVGGGRLSRSMFGVRQQSVQGFG